MLLAPRTRLPPLTQGLRILTYACDRASEHPNMPLAIWRTLEKEVQVRLLALRWVLDTLLRVLGQETIQALP